MLSIYFSGEIKTMVVEDGLAATWQKRHLPQIHGVTDSDCTRLHGTNIINKLKITIL